MAESSYQAQAFDVASATVPHAGVEHEFRGGRVSRDEDATADPGFPAQPIQSLMTERFPLQAQFEDRWTGVAFLAQLLLTLLWSVSSMGRVRAEVAQGLQMYDGMAVGLLLCSFWGIALSLGWLYLLSKMAHAFILIWGGGQLVLCLVSTTLLLSKGYLLPGLFIIALGALQAVWLFQVRDRVAFAGLLLDHCGRVVASYSGVAMLVLAALLALMVYVVFWAFILQDLYTLDMVLWVGVMLLLFFWTSQVLHGVVFTTVAGVVATWYFLQAHSLEDPTLPCLKRSVTTAFGSVCLGAGGIFWVRIAEVLARARSGGNVVLAVVQQRVQDWTDQAMQYFNSYALVHVAVYNKPYVYAAMDTVHLIRQCGLSPVVADSLIHPLALFTSVGGGCAVGSLVALSTMPTPTFLCAWLVTSAAIGVTTATVMSAVLSLLVCFAEEPDTLRLTNPELHQRLSHVLAGLAEGEP